MDDKELMCLFTGYGYQVCIVDDLEHINDDLHGALEWALAEIKQIQKAARSGKALVKPRWPMIVLRTPKVHLRVVAHLCMHGEDADMPRRGGQDPKRWMGTLSRVHSILTRSPYQRPSPMSLSWGNSRNGYPATVCRS